MGAVRTVIYFGKDDEFFTQLKDFTATQLRRDFEVKNRDYRKGDLLQVGLELSPNIVFIDTPTEGGELEAELSCYKQVPELKHTLFILLLKDSEEALSKAHYLILGVQLFFIKGNETEALFKDSFYLGLDEACGVSRFAKAKDLAINLTAGFTSSITGLKPDSMLIECDIRLESPLLLNLPFMDNMPSLECEVVTSSSSGFLLPMLETYEVSFPFPGPWDEVRPESLQPETIETFLDLKKEEFDKRKDSVFIFSENTTVIHKQWENPSLFLDFRQEASEEEVTRMDLKRPLIVFIEESEKIKFDVIYQLVASALKIQDYSPLFVILNTQSSTEALRKLFKYEKLISSSNPLDPETFGQMLTKLEGKVLSNGLQQSGWSFLKKDDKCRMMSIESTVLLTSITEHEMTFVSEVEIPMFTIMQFSLPIPMYVTVVPPKYDLTKPRSGMHYEAIIHGLSEEELKKLRKIVNQMIYKPVKSLDAESVDKMLKQKLEAPEVKQQVSVVEAKTPAAPQSKVSQASTGSGRFKVNRKQIAGKSKL
ncbi:MAG: hypothetical protein ACLGHN_14635 [Bacteriovoracia bacterium]